MKSVIVRFWEVMDNFLRLTSPCKDVAAYPRPHGFIGMVYSKGQGRDAATATDNPVTPVRYSGECLLFVRLRQQEERWTSRVPLQVPSPSVILLTDAQKTGWGLHLLDLTAAGIWTREELGLHINILEMKALIAPGDWIMGESVVLMT